MGLFAGAEDPEEAEGAGARIYEYDRPGIDRMIDAEMERGGAHEPVAP